MISNFASNVGKKGGEFFTPSEVSELLSRLVKPEENDRVYDPTCGSGSLLIKAFAKVPNSKTQTYGKERNGQTHSLCRMNMLLHKIDDAKILYVEADKDHVSLQVGGCSAEGHISHIYADRMSSRPLGRLQKTLKSLR